MEFQGQFSQKQIYDYNAMSMKKVRLQSKAFPCLIKIIFLKVFRMFMTSVNNNNNNNNNKVH